MTARIRSSDGWAVGDAVLTVTSLTGQQLSRVTADPDGTVAVPDAIPAGTHTAIVTAAGFAPLARVAIVPEGGTAALGDVELEREGGAPVPPAGTWAIDPAHSSIGMTVRHLGIAGVRGQITEFAGTITATAPLENSAVEVEMKSASLDTNNRMRDEILRSPAFLDAEAHPLLEYRGSGMRPAARGRWTLDGRLSLHGVEREVPLDVTCLGQVDDPWGGERIAFHATAELHRKDFAISFDEKLISGVAQIGNTVRVELDVQAVRER
ncbi:hypothetical protein HCA44_02215 [Rhodococcus sp. HNM0569]|nr:hypothetical protein [Rhodococcus sp. HNM0569]